MEPNKENLSKMLQDYVTVRQLIEADIEANSKQGHDYSGSIPCPICKTGTVHYGYAGGYNGHIHANCTTEECTQWME